MEVVKYIVLGVVIVVSTYWNIQEKKKAEKRLIGIETKTDSLQVQINQLKKIQK